MKILVTGGAGFIGSNFIRMLLLNHPEHEVINLDKLTYAGNSENLADITNNPRYKFYLGDICQPDHVEQVLNGVEAIVHFAAETHVDRSILDAAPFVVTNIFGTQLLLDFAREAKVSRFIYVSTYQVGGNLLPGIFLRENSPVSPSNAYAASKASAEHLVYAAYNIHQFSAVTVRLSNCYGPYQFPEKLIPLIIANALEFKPLPVYGDGLHIRDWIYIEDACQAIYQVLLKGKAGQIYNVGANCEKTNLETIRRILKMLDRPEKLITFVADRLGHDRRYALDTGKLHRELTWHTQIDFEEGLRRTIDWYLRNIEWLADTRSTSAYREYYDTVYSSRFAVNPAKTDF